MTDYSKFASVVSLVAFHPFKTAQAALENLNSITEGIVPDDLHAFITQVGLKGITLGVIENKLAAALTEAFPKMKLRVGPVVLEICRGIRAHFHKLVKSLPDETGEYF